MIKVLENTYTPEWFRQRAFNSLRKIEDSIWDYSDSLLLYMPGGESEYESIQQGEDEYFKLITKPESDFLHEISEKVVEQLPQNFEYIDLGPGTAHKEQIVFGAAKQQNKVFTYSAVDISAYYLKLATEYASNRGIRVNPIQSSFEELPDKLTNSELPRFVSLGLTFTNYFPKEIIDLLKRIAGKDGYIFIDAQDRNEVDMKRIVRTYDKDVRAISESKLKLLGLDLTKDISEIHTDDGIRIWCRLKNSNAELEKKGVKAGDSLLMLQSLRYTRESFERELKEAATRYILLDGKSGFIGALILPGN